MVVVDFPTSDFLEYLISLTELVLLVIFFRLIDF